MLFCACDDTLMANYNKCVGFWPDLLRHLGGHTTPCLLCISIVLSFCSAVNPELELTAYMPKLCQHSVHTKIVAAALLL